MWEYVWQTGRCEVPGCTDRFGLSPHHVRKRSQGGGDAIEGPDRNIAVLCGKHHSMAEERRLLIAKTPAGWLFSVVTAADR